MVQRFAKMSRNKHWTALYDSHTHLNDDAFYDDAAAYVARADHYGVVKMNMVGSNAILNQRAVALVQRFSNMRALVGWHPEDSKNYDQAAEDELLRQLDQPRVVGIGEIGLDYHWDTSPRDVQKRVFKRQLAIAAGLHVPVSIHCREALADAYPLLKQAHVGDFGGVMHSFEGDPSWIPKFLDLGMDISFSGIASFNNAKQVHQAVKLVPDDRLMIETDAPYLTPVPYRGCQNEPAFTYYVCQAVAKLRDEDPERVAYLTYHNACRLFDRGDDQS